MYGKMAKMQPADIGVVAAAAVLSASLELLR